MHVRHARRMLPVLLAASALSISVLPVPAGAGTVGDRAPRTAVDTRTISVPATVEVVTDVGPDKRCLVYALVKWQAIPEADDSTSHVVHYVSYGQATSRTVVAPFDDTVPGVVAPITVEPGYHWISIAQAGAMDINNPSGCPQAAAAFRTSHVGDHVEVTVEDRCSPARRALKKAKAQLKRLRNKAEDAKGTRLQELRADIRKAKGKVRRAKTRVERHC